MKRYGFYKGREVLLLQSLGCVWNRCTFCEYCLDNEKNAVKCHHINEQVINQITGRTGIVEVIDSGSFFELPVESLLALAVQCEKKGVKELRVETHDMYRKSFPMLDQMMMKYGITVKYRCGIESFDEYVREQVLNKGYGKNIQTAKDLKEYSYINLLVGFEGDDIARIREDIEKAKQGHFDGVTINVFDRNNKMNRDEKVVNAFYQIVNEMKLNSHPLFEILDGTKDKQALDGVGFTEDNEK